jgi:hypothetical protein
MSIKIDSGVNITHMEDKFFFNFKNIMWKWLAKEIQFF